MRFNQKFCKKLNEIGNTLRYPDMIYELNTKLA